MYSGGRTSVVLLFGRAMTPPVHSLWSFLANTYCTETVRRISSIFVNELTGLT